MSQQADGHGMPRVAVMHLGRHGGGPKFAFELARGLSLAGAEVHSVISATADNRSDFEQLGRTVAMTTFSNAAEALVRAPLALAHGVSLARHLRRHDIDVLVVAMEQIWQPAVLAVAKLAGRPILVCVHDAMIHPGEGGRAAQSLRNAQRRLADGFIVFSDHVARALAPSAAGRPVHRTVHGAFGQSRISERVLPSGVPVVGFFGRLAEYKGLGIGYAAIRALREDGRRVVFRVVGAGDDPALQEMTHPDDELLVGWTDDSEVEGVLEAIDVLLLPYREASQSGVLAYAMAAGLPTVVTPVGGLAQQAIAGGVGVVADRVDPTAVAAALGSVLDDPSRYSALSAAGLEAASRSYSWDRVATDVLSAVAATLRPERRMTRLRPIRD